MSVGLLAWSACWHSPVGDEVAHLAAGISYWQLGAFDLYRVNPPLCRLVAGLPLIAAGADLDWNAYYGGPDARPEWRMGSAFARTHPENWHYYFLAGRLALLPLILVGGFVSLIWARELYGEWAGILAFCLWSFSPNILAWGSTLTPDVSAASMGVLACYCFWKWIRAPQWPLVFLAGLTLGLAELTKMTWIILFPLWPTLWLTWIASRRPSASWKDWRRQGMQLVVILLVALYVLNLGYGFEGTFQQLKDYIFVSRTLAGADAVSEGKAGGNLFASSWLGNFPVPLPKNYLSGMDLQKLDFEYGMGSFLMGQWKHGGWWYYYLICAVFKVPLGTWCLGFLALATTLWSLLRQKRPALDACAPGTAEDQQIAAVGSQGALPLATTYFASWRHELILLAPAVVVFIFVSSQTGFSHTFRYVIPCFPFVFIWMSKVARSFSLLHWRIALPAVLALLWSILSSLLMYPHSMSYFNELAGGPRHGHDFLIDVNRGQDLWYLKKWYDAHPEARPLLTEVCTLIPLGLFGIEAETPADLPTKQGDLGIPNRFEQLSLQPGWYAMDVAQLHEQNSPHGYFLQYFEPVETIGYSIYIYHITAEEANRVQRVLGLPPLVYSPN